MPSSCLVAFVEILLRSEPDCGSLKFIVPVQLPATKSGRYISFCPWFAWKLIPDIAPILNPGPRTNAIFAVQRISRIAADRP